MPAAMYSGRPWESAERRAAADRRIGERRSHHVAVASDRRRGPDRRGHLSRRETAEGHLRNAIQIISGLSHDDPPLNPEIKKLVDDLLRRLHLALAETKLLASSRAQLGDLLRKSIPHLPGRGPAD
ncbi:MAG TPA: hypothetical protein VNL18_06825 [Gemmatimonadales bacterium]|nr:hypothetical protein [Gemmatimonadales bacterium]